MKKKELYEQVTAYFMQAMPEAETELHYDSPFQLLVAVILSAQCTDKRVNTVTPRLFEDYPTAEAMALATPEVIYDYVKSVSYPNNKARHLVGMAQMLLKEFGGKVPDTLEKLVRLPGVGRKTANVVLSNAFGIPAFAVDTHVFRVSNRLGLCEANTVEETERQMTALIPEEKWGMAHHWLIWHGRRVCKAQHPMCETCGLRGLCPWPEKNK